MTRFLSSLVLLAALAGCAAPSGAPAARIADPAIAAAYIPLWGRTHLGTTAAAGAAMVIAPGIAVTNAHNANLLGAKSVIGKAAQSDLMFFHTRLRAVPVTASPVPGAMVTAYGQDLHGGLRVAEGVVDRPVAVTGYATAPYFTFHAVPGHADAGPGFSGGPVLDAQGRLVGITFGYTDGRGGRRIYAYGMDRVRAELSALPKGPDSPTESRGF